MVFIVERDQGQVFVDNVDVPGFLPAVFGNFLREVAVGVQKSDRHQRDAQVAGFFQVVAGKHAQTAGIHHQRFVQPVFE